MTNLTIDSQTLARVTRLDATEAALIKIGCRKLTSHDGVWVAPDGQIRRARAILREHITPGQIVGEAQYSRLTEEDRKLPTNYWRGK